MLRRLLRRERPTARRHDAQRLHLFPGAHRFGLDQVIGHPRPQIGLGGGRTRALVFPEYRQDLVTRRHGDVWKLGTQRGGEPALMVGVTECEEQRDRNRFRASPLCPTERADGGGHAGDLALGERGDDAVRPHPLTRADHIARCHERFRMGLGEVVQRRPVLPPEPQQVLEPGGRHEHDARPGPLEQRVGRDGRAVYEDVDDSGAEHVQRAQQTYGGVLRRARDFPDFETAVGFDCDEIGECPADVNADARHGRKRRCMRKTIPVSVNTTTSKPTQSPRRTYSGMTFVVRTTPAT